MKLLGTLDKGDYSPDAPRTARRAARAIIRSGRALVMVRSEKYGEYKFPGGGIKHGESAIVALVREVREETGFAVILSSIREYGATIERRKNPRNNSLYEHTSYYYYCDVESVAGTPQLEGYEIDYGYTVRRVQLAEAIAANERLLSKAGLAGAEPVLAEPPWVERELFVLKTLLPRNAGRKN